MASVDTSVSIDRELMVELSESDLIQRGHEMAACELKIGMLKDERTVLATRIKQQEQERKRLSGVVDTRRETRPVKCKWYPDWAQRKWRLRRLDNHTEVECMDMTAADRQLDLYAVPPSNDNDQHAG